MNCVTLAYKIVVESQFENVIAEHLNIILRLFLNETVFAMYLEILSTQECANSRKRFATLRVFYCLGSKESDVNCSQMESGYLTPITSKDVSNCTFVATI